MYYLMIALLVIVDQWTKYSIRTGMALNQTIPVIQDVFHITYIQNFGAAFSILQNKQVLLIGVSGVAVAIMLFYLVRKKKELHGLVKCALAFVIAGGLGNLIDRLSLSYVVDFFDFRVFPVFNVADIAVCLGCGLLMFYVLFLENKKSAK